MIICMIFFFFFCKCTKRSIYASIAVLSAYSQICIHLIWGILLHNYHFFKKNPVLYYTNYSRKIHLWNTINSQAVKQQQPPHINYHPLLPLTQTDLFNDSQTCHHGAIVVWKHVHTHTCVSPRLCVFMRVRSPASERMAGLWVGGRAQSEQIMLIVLGRLWKLDPRWRQRRRLSLGHQLLLQHLSSWSLQFWFTQVRGTNVTLYWLTTLNCWPWRRACGVVVKNYRTSF